MTNPTVTDGDPLGFYKMLTNQLETEDLNCTDASIAFLLINAALVSSDGKQIEVLKKCEVK